MAPAAEMPGILAVSVVPKVHAKSGLFPIMVFRNSLPLVSLRAVIMSCIFSVPVGFYGMDRWQLIKAFLFVLHL